MSSGGVTSFGGHRRYHRPIEFYVKRLASAGLVVIDICEPPSPLGQAQGRLRRP